MRELRNQAANAPATDVGGEITASDASADVPPALDSSREGPGDDRLATEQELAPDPGDTKQPH